MSSSDLRQRLAAILAADAVGYSRLMAEDDRGTVRTLDAARSVFRANIESNQGRVIDMAGDSVLAVFDTATGAVNAALGVQKELGRDIDAVIEDRRMLFRIGVHLGDVIEKADGTIYGDGVNIAARLEGLGEPGGVMVSDAVRGAVKGKVGAEFEDLGEQKVKNIAEPVRAFRVRAKGAATTPAAVEAALPLPAKPSIAVLPFTNMSGEPEQQYFTDGITEDIITELSRFRELFVIARNSSFSYRGQWPDVRRVGKELGVRYVLEGSIRRAGTRIRVTAQLIDALDGKHVWGDKYDRVLEDIFAVQEEITRSIVAAIAPQIGLAELAKIRLKRPGSLTAYELAMRARMDAYDAYKHLDRRLCEEAIREAHEALAIEPDNVIALSALAFCGFQQVLFNTALDRQQAWSDGMAACARAIASDPSSNLPYTWRGLLQIFAAEPVRWEEALFNLRHACDLNPNETLSLSTLGWGEAVAGNPDIAVEYLDRAARINPRDTWTLQADNMRAIALFIAKEYAASIESAVAANSAAPSLPQPLIYIALSCVGLGDVGRAKEAFERARRLAPEHVQARMDGIGASTCRRESDRERLRIFLRIAAGLEDPSAADGLR